MKKGWKLYRVDMFIEYNPKKMDKEGEGFVNLVDRLIGAVTYDKNMVGGWLGGTPVENNGWVKSAKDCPSCNGRGWVRKK